MKKILVLEGGFNEEHEISLNTSKEVQKSLERMKFKFEVLQVNPENFSEKIVFYDDDVLCFNALHGTYGEDGTIQKILENNKLTYTHSDSKVSKIAFDKNLTKTKIKNSEVVFLESLILDKSQITIDQFYKAYSRFSSFVLKPVSSGSFTTLVEKVWVSSSVNSVPSPKSKSLGVILVSSNLLLYSSSNWTFTTWRYFLVVIISYSTTLFSSFTVSIIFTYKWIIVY